MKRPERYVVQVTLDKRIHDLLIRAAEADWNTPEYELRIAVRLGLQQLLGEEIDEDE